MRQAGGKVTESDLKVDIERARLRHTLDKENILPVRQKSPLISYVDKSYHREPIPSKAMGIERMIDMDLRPMDQVIQEQKRNNRFKEDYLKYQEGGSTRKKSRDYFGTSTNLTSPCKNAFRGNSPFKETHPDYSDPRYSLHNKTYSAQFDRYHPKSSSKEKVPPMMLLPAKHSKEFDNRIVKGDIDRHLVRAEGIQEHREDSRSKEYRKCLDEQFKKHRKNNLSPNSRSRELQKRRDQQIRAQNNQERAHPSSPDSKPSRSKDSLDDLLFNNLSLKSNSQSRDKKTPNPAHRTPPRSPPKSREGVQREIECGKRREKEQGLSSRKPSGRGLNDSTRLTEGLNQTNLSHTSRTPRTDKTEPIEWSKEKGWEFGEMTWEQSSQRQERVCGRFGRDNNPEHKKESKNKWTKVETNKENEERYLRGNENLNKNTANLDNSSSSMSKKGSKKKNGSKLQSSSIKIKASKGAVSEKKRIKTPQKPTSPKPSKKHQNAHSPDRLEIMELIHKYYQ